MDNQGRTRNTSGLGQPMETTESTAVDYSTWRVKTEVYSRVVGYLRPTSSWNTAKQLEFASARAAAIRWPV